MALLLSLSIATAFDRDFQESPQVSAVASELRRRDPAKFDRVAAELSALPATIDGLDPLTVAEIVVRMAEEEAGGDDA